MSDGFSIEVRGQKKQMKKSLTNKTKYPKRDGTIVQSGLSAPVSSGFFMPHVWVDQSSIWRACPPSFWRVKRAEYNTRKGNKPRRLCTVVETRHSFLAKQLITKETSL